MTTANITATPDRTLLAGGMVLVYAMVIGFTDNYVRVIAAEAGLWQFHATRAVMAWAILLALMAPLRFRLRPVNLKAVVARSAIHGGAMLIFAFEAVIIGGLGSLWGTLLGGMVLGISQALGSQINPSYGVLIGNLVFLAILAFRPTGLLPKAVTP